MALGLGQPARSQSGDVQTIAFGLGGHDRSFLLYQPRGLSGQRPLVLVIHGGGDTARGMMRLTRERWNALADRHGFYVVYPNSLDRLWDFGEGRVSASLNPRVDDLTYFRTVIATVQSRVSVDSSRIFATGLSRGGQASFYLACNLPGEIRAIMPVGMNLPEFMRNECRSGPPVGLALVMGTDDPQVPYNGGWITVFGRQRDQVLSADATLALWRGRNRCGAGPTQTTTDQRPLDRTTLTTLSWACGSAPVVHFRVEGGGHTWPSGRQFLPVRLVGRVSREMDAADAGWAFFSQF